MKEETKEDILIALVAMGIAGMVSFSGTKLARYIRAKV